MGVGARAHTNLESHLSLVRPLGFGVPELHFGGQGLSPSILKRGDSSTGGLLFPGGAQFSPGSSNPTPGSPFKGRQLRMEAVPAPSSPRSSTLRTAATLLP